MVAAAEVATLHLDVASADVLRSSESLSVLIGFEVESQAACFQVRRAQRAEAQMFPGCSGTCVRGVATFQADQASDMDTGAEHVDGAPAVDGTKQKADEQTALTNKHTYEKVGRNVEYPGLRGVVGKSLDNQYGFARHTPNIEKETLTRQRTNIFLSIESP